MVYKPFRWTYEMKNQQISLQSLQSTRPERYSHWTNGCVNSCVNSPEDGPMGPKHVEIRWYMNKIEIVTSVGFSFHMLKGCTVKNAENFRMKLRN
jgi:hypothetical protein